MAPRSKKHPVQIDEAPQADANITVGEFGTDAPGTQEGTDGGAPETPSEPEGSEEPDSQPEPEFVSYTAPRFHWPVSTEPRQLKVLLDHNDLQEVSLRLAQIIPDTRSLQREAKASASSYKSSIEKLEIEQGELADIIIDGCREASVPCTWVFECSGVDADGARVFNADYKALFRDDTGEFVDSARIQTSERQMALTLPDEQAPEQEAQAESAENEGAEEQTSAEADAPETQAEEGQVKF